LNIGFNLYAYSSKIQSFILSVFSGKICSHYIIVGGKITEFTGIIDIFCLLQSTKNVD